MPKTELISVPLDSAAGCRKRWIDQNHFRGNATGQKVVDELGMMASRLEPDKPCKLSSSWINLIRNDGRVCGLRPHGKTARAARRLKHDIAATQFHWYVARYAIGTGVENC